MRNHTNSCSKTGVFQSLLGCKLMVIAFCFCLILCSLNLSYTKIITINLYNTLHVMLVNLFLKGTPNTLLHATSYICQLSYRYIHLNSRYQNKHHWNIFILKRIKGQIYWKSSHVGKIQLYNWYSILFPWYLSGNIIVKVNRYYQSWVFFCTICCIIYVWYLNLSVGAVTLHLFLSIDQNKHILWESCKQYCTIYQMGQKLLT